MSSPHASHSRLGSFRSNTISESRDSVIWKVLCSTSPSVYILKYVLPTVNRVYISSWRMHGHRVDEAHHSPWHDIVHTFQPLEQMCASCSGCHGLISHLQNGRRRGFQQSFSLQVRPESLILGPDLLGHQANVGEN